ncbi:hypothetical protein D3C78_1475620 [compost metagenome]
MGLLGVFNSTHFVRGVMACSNACGVSLKPSASGQASTTGVPSLTSTMSGYDTQYGAGMMTSSPACTVAASAVKINCLAPTPTISSSSP